MSSQQPPMRAVAAILVGGVLFLVGTALIAASVAGVLAGYVAYSESWLPLLYGGPMAVVGFLVAKKGKRGLNTAL